MQDKNEIFYQIRQDTYTLAQRVYSMAEYHWIYNNISPEEFVTEAVAALKYYFMKILKEAKENDEYDI